jgi:hypothetical protein
MFRRSCSDTDAKAIVAADTRLAEMTPRPEWTLTLPALRILFSLGCLLGGSDWGLFLYRYRRVPMSCRRFQSRLLWILTLVLVSSVCVDAQQAVVDLEGHPVNPLTENPGKVVVLIFVRLDCPVSSRYAPVIQQISLQYAGRANFWLVDPDKNDSPLAIRKYLADYGYRLPALRDPEHALVKLGHVLITPEVAVFYRDHAQVSHLAYDGRIDDWYVALGSARAAPTTHELEDAIRAAAAGKPAVKSEVRGVGCYISDLE